MTFTSREGQKQAVWSNASGGVQAESGGIPIARTVMSLRDVFLVPGKCCSLLAPCMDTPGS